MDLKSLREKKGFTLRELAAKSGVVNTNISAMETHKIDMGDNAARKLGPVLGVKAEALKAAQAEARLLDLGERFTQLDPETLAEVTGATPEKAQKAIKALLALAEEDLHPEIKSTISQTLIKLLKATQQAAEKSTRQPDRDGHGRKRPASQEVKRDPAGRRRGRPPVQRDGHGRRI